MSSYRPQQTRDMCSPAGDAVSGAASDTGNGEGTGRPAEVAETLVFRVTMLS